MLKPAIACLQGRPLHLLITSISKNYERGGGGGGGGGKMTLTMSGYRKYPYPNHGMSLENIHIQTMECHWKL